MFKSILLYTNQLKHLRRFYRNVLGLDTQDVSESQFTVIIGPSKLIFAHTEQPARYKFAINIPGNQFIIMKEWIEDRVSLIRQAGLTTFYADSFDADYMSFLDPAGNVVKLIARRNKDFFGELTADAFLNISEVSLITPHLVDIGNDLQDLGLPLHYGFKIDPHTVNYLGSEDTYIALEPPFQKQIFLRQEEIATHPLTITLTTGQLIHLDAAGNVTYHQE